MLTVLILIVLAAAALIATGLYIAQNVRVTKSVARSQTTVETPFGTLRVREGARLDPRQFGVPVYPGAVRVEDSRKLVGLQFDFGEHHKGLSVVAAEYRTPDSLDSVCDFYRTQLPHWMFSQKTRGIQLELTEGGYRKIIVIHREDGATRIGLASVGEPESN
jgi:hypothetical protein